MGFKKPKSEVKAEYEGEYAWYNPAYSIGELIEFLYDRIIPIKLHYEKGGFDYLHLTLEVLIDGMWCTILDKRNLEFVDFLFEALVKLKQEKIIW